MATDLAKDDAQASSVPLKYVVRCGAMRTLHVASAKSKHYYGEKVIVRTGRGIETGEVLVEATQQVLSHMSDPPSGQVLRSISNDDSNDISHIADQIKREIAICEKHIQRLQLDMKLVDLEHLLGGERIVIYYLSEKRVDFRQLVRDLTSEFQTRIEMRQIGVRDEAKLLADFGDCGKPVCCNTHLSAMPPVSMRMAKLQKATLDPSKISGRCGRLKCCLRYEFDTYEELQRELPAIGSQILTREGRATVIYQEILAQQLLVQTDDKRRILIDVSDVLTVVKKDDQDDNRSSEAEQDSSAKNTEASSNSGKRETK